MSDNRKQQAFNIRVRAARLARDRQHETFEANGEEERYVRPNDTSVRTYLGSYTKGLPHNRRTGLVTAPKHFERFVDAINSGSPRDFIRVPLGPRPDLEFNSEKECRDANLFKSGIARRTCLRAWESMGAGHVFDLEGPDAQACGMPPAPKLDSDELAAEISELYWMSLIRDVKFSDFSSDRTVRRAANRLNKMPWIRMSDDPSRSLKAEERRRLRGPFTLQNVFRGALPGDDVGPYISQFLLAGTEGIGDIHSRADGYIRYGAHRIDQRVRHARENLDYMTTWEAFLDVQNGADVGEHATFESGNDAYRFITTPRDLATFVHFDALYQAYLNACLIMIDNKVPYDEGMPFRGKDFRDHQRGFAHFGDPHILTLVTEVATRALKAARFQKFNTHRRLRPEAVCGLVERFHNEQENELFAGVKPLYQAIDQGLLNSVAEHNEEQNQGSDRGVPRARDFNPAGEILETRLLPMAFPEGSPMHPSYGAGHATVAGACVTVLKAFFKHDERLPFCFVPNEDGTKLVDNSKNMRGKLTVEGELNKACSNISIGRNWAGVHYYSDYYESILLGEEIAIGILEEQMLTYPENFHMTLPRFNGDTIRITSDGIVPVRK